MALTKRQLEYFRHPTQRINLLYGSVRSGKTWVSLIQWAAFIESRPATEDFLMVGKSVTTLKRNCLEPLFDILPTNKFSYSLGQKTAHLFGRTIWLEGANDARSESKIRGLTLAGAYVDELTQIPEDFYKMLLSRLSMPGARLFATTNPDTPEHYVYRDIINNENIERQAARFLLEENTFLPEEYVRNIQREYTGIYYQRFILGNWVRAEGVIFRQFADNPERFIITGDDKRLADIYTVCFGLDYGENYSHTVIVASGILRRGAGVIALAERVLDSKGISPDKIEQLAVTFVRDVKAQYPGLRLSYIFCDHPETITNGVDRALQATGLQVRAVTAKKEQINTRIYAQERMFNTERLFIRDCCPKLIYSLKNQAWDAGKQNDTRLDNNPDVSDLYDAFEYSWMHFIDEIGVR